MRHLKPLAFALAAAGFMPSAGYAQPTEPAAATTFSELTLQLPPSSSLIITDQQGRRTTGSLISIERDRISLKTAMRNVTLAESDVRQVDHKIPDSVLNGGFIGMFIGAMGPMIVCMARSDSSETVGCAIASVGFGGSAGFAVGALVDRLRGRRVTLFRR